MVAFDLFLQEMTYKEFTGLFSIVLSFGMFIPYLFQLIRGKVRPHVFTWLLWGFLSSLIWLAQYTEAGGAGAWLTAFDAISCFAVALLSIRNGMGIITRSDWAVLVITVLALPVWWVTESPLISVILITSIDTLSFFPAFRKAYSSPFDESAPIYLSGGAELLLSLVAMDAFSTVNVLNPALNMAYHIGLGLLILVRQHMVRMANARLLSRRYATVRAELIKDTGWTARRQRLQERRYAHALRTVSNHCKTIGYETAHRWFNAA